MGEMLGGDARRLRDLRLGRKLERMTLEGGTTGGAVIALRLGPELIEIADRVVEVTDVKDRSKLIRSLIAEAVLARAEELGILDEDCGVILAPREVVTPAGTAPVVRSANGGDGDDGDS